MADPSMVKGSHLRNLRSPPGLCQRICLLNLPSLSPILLSCSGCATTVLVTGAGIGEMVLQMLVGSVCRETQGGGMRGVALQAVRRCGQPLLNPAVPSPGLPHGRQGPTPSVSPVSPSEPPLEAEPPNAGVEM